MNYLLIILLFVITISTHTFLLQADAISLIDESTILQTGIISTHTNDYYISNNLNLKFFIEIL